jgi:type VI secretion system protein ImpH
MAGVYLSVPDVDYARLCALLPPPWKPDHAAADEAGARHRGAQSHPPADAHAHTHAHTATHTHRHAREATLDDGAPLDGHAGLVHMVQLLFDRRVDCVVELTTRAAQLPESVLTATPGTGETAPSMPPVATLQEGVRYAGLRLGQTSWLAASGVHADDVRHVRFTIAGDLAEASR